jgi:hypothetical protein
MVLKIPITEHQKKILHYLVVVGGIVVTLGAIPEYLRGGVKPFIAERTGEQVTPGLGLLWSTLGRGYFHIAMFSTVSSVLTFSLFYSLKKPLSKLLCLVLGVFTGWPAFFCGSRAGVVAGFLSWVVLFLFAKVSFKTAITAFVMITLMFLLIFSPRILSLSYLEEKSVGISRALQLKEEERLHRSWYHFELYRWQIRQIPFIGGGFYVVPVVDPGGTLRFRAGYGIHNDYLFAIEQGGLVAFGLFIAFLVSCHRNFRRMRKTDNNEEDRAFATGISAFFYAL